MSIVWWEKNSYRSQLWLINIRKKMGLEKNADNRGPINWGLTVNKNLAEMGVFVELQ